MSEERTRRYYDDFSATYDRGRDEGYHAMIDRLEAEIVLPHAAGARVLEVGAGTGLLLGRIAEVAERAVGVDLSAGMLARARARGLTVVRGSAAALPFGNASFDLVYSFKVLAHVPEIDRALAEIARVTRPGGHAVLEFYNARSLRYLARRLAGARRIGREHRESDVTTRWETPDAILARLPRSLEVVQSRGVRVLTPFAGAIRAPLVGAALAAAERWASASPLRRFGGFFVVITRRCEP